MGMIVTPAGQGCIMSVADPRAVFFEQNGGCIFVYYLFRQLLIAESSSSKTMDILPPAALRW
jgi:hypothetical protein